LIRRLAACLILATVARPVDAAELKVLSAVAFNAVAMTLVPAF